MPPEISGMIDADPGIPEIVTAALVADGGERLFLGFVGCWGWG